MVIADNEESEFDSGEGASKMDTTSKEGGRPAIIRFQTERSPTHSIQNNGYLHVRNFNVIKCDWLYSTKDYK